MVWTVPPATWPMVPIEDCCRCRPFPASRDTMAKPPQMAPRPGERGYTFGGGRGYTKCGLVGGPEQALDY